MLTALGDWFTEAFQRGEVDAVGAMVHRVVKEVDCGELVVVREVEIRKGEPLAAYEERSLSSVRRQPHPHLPSQGWGLG